MLVGQIVRAGDAFDVFDVFGRVVRYHPATAAAEARSEPIRVCPAPRRPSRRSPTGRWWPPSVASAGGVGPRDRAVRAGARRGRCGGAVRAAPRVARSADRRAAGRGGHRGEEHGIDYLLAVDDDRFVVAGYDEPGIQLWSARERRCLARVNTDHQEGGRFSRPYAMSVHPPSKRLIVSHWDNQVDVWSLAGDAFQRERTLVLSSPYEHALLSDDGAMLFVAHDHGVVALDFPSCAPRWRWDCPRDIEAVAALADGRVAVGTRDGGAIRRSRRERGAASTLPRSFTSKTARSDETSFRSVRSRHRRRAKRTFCGCMDADFCWSRTREWTHTLRPASSGTGYCHEPAAFGRV